MELKPRIFVGSSTEGLPVARSVKECMSGWADCTIWNEKVFSFNKSYFETLLDSINLYDYGVLVVTGDDFTRSRHKLFQSPRDNVVFEFGLFLGRLGRKKVFFLRQEGTKLPSDLLGISLPAFPAKAGAGRSNALREICAQIREELDKLTGSFELGLLPSVSLAYGYFNNFVRRTCDRLLEEKHITVDRRRVAFRDFRFRILIPDNLSDDMYDKVKAERSQRAWKPIKVDAGGQRPYDFHVDLSANKEGCIEIYDIPLTLNSLHQSIQQYLHKSHLGKDFYETMLEHREISAFSNVLNELIKSNALTRPHVSTEIVPV
jgi:hypothetical protein